MHIHADNHSNASIDKKLFIVITLNIIITVSEIIGGIISGSLALLSDAFHNFSDVFSLIITFFAIKIAKKEKDEKKTFGYKRTEILAALLNVILLFLAAIYIIYEAIKRFFSPSAIDSNTMFIVTLIGLLGNLFSVIFLHKNSKENLNIKSSFLHLLGDTFSSLGVLAVALILLFLPNLFFLDSIISVLIVIYILRESFSIFFDVLNILMQGTPKGLDIKKIKERLLSDKELAIIDVHHIHSWSLSDQEIVFDCHVVIKNDISVHNINAKIKNINNILKKDFNICHSTIQIETEDYQHDDNCLI